MVLSIADAQDRMSLLHGRESDPAYYAPTLRNRLWYLSGVSLDGSAPTIGKSRAMKMAVEWLRPVQAARKSAPSPEAHVPTFSNVHLGVSA